MKHNVILAACMFTYFAACSAVAPFMTLYLSQSLTPFEIGIVMAVLPVSMILFQPIWGRAADKWGCRRILMVALLMTALSTAGFLAAHSFRELLLVYSIYSFFIISISALIDALTLSICGGRYGRIRLWGTAGYGIGVFLSGVFKSSLLGRWSFIIHMLLMLLTLIIVVNIPDNRHEKPLTQQTGKKDENRLPLKNFRFLLLLFSFFLTGVVCKGYENFFPVGISELKASDFLLGTAWIIEMIPEIILLYYLDRIIVRISVWYILIAGTIAFALRMAILGSFPVLWVWIASQPLSSLAFSFWYFGAVNLMNKITGGQGDASGQALFWSVSYGFGGMAGSLLSGYLVHTLTIMPYFRVASVLGFISSAILLVLCKIGKANNLPPSSLHLNMFT